MPLIAKASIKSTRLQSKYNQIFCNKNSINIVKRREEKEKREEKEREGTIRKGRRKEGRERKGRERKGGERKGAKRRMGEGGEGG